MQSKELHNHIHATYFALRIGLAALAGVLPVLLLVLGFLRYDIPLQPSISDYYFALANRPPFSFPMRGWFVGILCAIGSFLILYRGFSNTENYLLNVAGVSALGVALIPMTITDKDRADFGDPVISWWPWAHFFFAALLFVCIAWVAWACSEETLGELPPDQQEKYRTKYDRHALLMVLFVVAALVLFMSGITSYSKLFKDYGIFVLEVFGVWVFAHYWYTKSLEMKESDADKKATEGRMAGPSRERTFADDMTESEPPAQSSAWPERLRRRAARIFDTEPMQRTRRSQ